MLFRASLLILMLSHLSSAYAQAGAELPIDLLELLGEMDDEDTEQLEAAIAELKPTSPPSKAGQNKPQQKIPAGEHQ